MSNASKVVTNLIDAFNASDLDRIMGHFTNDAVYHNMPVAPVSGLKAIREVVQGFMGMASKVDWQLRHIAETSGGVVLTERVDRFLIKGKWVELPVMGTFEVIGGKIGAWRDYFDMNQFQSQLAG
jgi:limonene-1,2-epoxide hydrolase